MANNQKGKPTIKNPGFTTTISVEQNPEETFAAINNVRGWWSGEIEGNTNKLGAEFTYRYEDVHRSQQKITEFVPGKRVVWQVLDSQLSFVKDHSEWTGTKIVFEISEKNGKTEVRFTHAGLVPEYECFDDCSIAWDTLVNGNLRKLIATGERQADAFA
jgi:Activator of Hsp90 ATPase homolog 1-like protein